MRRRVALVAGALGLVVGGVFASVRLPGGADRAATDSLAPEHGRRVPRVGRRRRAGTRRSTPQCSYGAESWSAPSRGWSSPSTPADGTAAVAALAPTRAWATAAAPSCRGGLVQISADKGRRLEALDPASGRTRWQRDAAGVRAERRTVGRHAPAHRARRHGHGRGQRVGRHQVEPPDSGAGRARTSPRSPGIRWRTRRARPTTGRSTRAHRGGPGHGCRAVGRAARRGAAARRHARTVRSFLLAVDSTYGNTEAVVALQPRVEDRCGSTLPVPRQGVQRRPCAGTSSTCWRPAVPWRPST